MKIVLDTNVLVSGLLTPYGSSGEIVRMVAAGILTLMYDSRIMTEYREVLYRAKFRFDKDEVDTMLAYIEYNGFIVPAKPLIEHLPDRDDEPFLEAAIAGKASSLITGNRSHVPQELRNGINVFSPSEFIKF